MQILVEDGVAIRSRNVENANIQTHIVANDQFADEAHILSEYIADDDINNIDVDPIAWKYADPIEGGRFLFNENEVGDIEREDKSLIRRLTVIWD